LLDVFKEQPFGAVFLGMKEEFFETLNISPKSITVSFSKEINF